MARICIVCPHHISMQPRSLREADTLAAAGHEVMVIVRHSDPVLAEQDRVLATSRPWGLRALDVRRDGPARTRWLFTALRSELARRAGRAGLRSPRLAVEGAVRGASSLVRMAADLEADIYIGHTQLGLPIAVEAAARNDAGAGFDCEDLLGESGTDDGIAIRAIEDEYVRRCDYVTAASQAMADRLGEQQECPVEVLYNVFPLELRGGLKPPGRREHGDPLRAHWFGQTLGPGRGLEFAIRAVARAGEGVELHLRGRVSTAYREHLTGLIDSADRVFFHAPIAHDDLIEAMGLYDVGLALERPEHGNYGLTVTNKLFSYATAGLAIAATDTVGQREALAGLNGAGALVPHGGVDQLGGLLAGWRDDRESLLAARTAAWHGIEERFCWDVEQNTFLDLLDPWIGNGQSPTPAGLDAPTMAYA